MNQVMVHHLPYFAAAWVFLVGLFGVIRSRNFIHLSICLAIIQSSTYLLLLTIGYRSHATAPIFLNLPITTRTVDPVVQALMLTDIVVETTVISLLLTLAVQIHKRTRNLDPNQVTSIKG